MDTASSATYQHVRTMISVLIPTYNYKCYKLVSDLQNQLRLQDEAYEIIVAEDGGKDQVVAISNHRINELDNCRYIRRQENVGRAAIRNFLAREAKGDWLLFMDSDGLVVRDDFIAKYVEAAKAGHDVVCGGISHPEQCPSREQSLRWKYEKSYEERNGNVSKAFRSFAFMIRKSVFDQILFSEECRRYGWEDVLFGLQLKEQGYTVYAIDNPLENRDIESNEVFLRKTEESMRTLVPFAERLSVEVSLLRFVRRIDAMHVSWLFSLLFAVTKPMLRRNLTGSSPNLKLYAFYKVGYYLSIR